MYICEFPQCLERVQRGVCNPEGGNLKNKDIQCLSPAKNGEYNRTREKWQLSDKLFEIATRAVSDDRTKRQQSIRQFTAEWEAAQ